MKKFVGKFLKFTIPFLLFFVWFLAFEPYDYFGLRGGTTYSNKQIYEMRRLLREQPTNIILGDSRMAHLDDDLMYEYSGEEYLNLAFGGATMGEIIDLFYYADAHTDLERVYIGISFFTINSTYHTDRVSGTIPLVLDPLVYLSRFTNYPATYNNMHATIDNLTYYIDNGEWYDETKQPPLSERDITYDENGYRSDIFEFATYHTQSPFPMFIFQPSTTYMERLKELALYCEEQGIEIIAVFPPVQQAYWDIVIDGMGYTEGVAGYKNELLQYFNAIDMEWQSEFIKDDTKFFDPFHLYDECYEQEFARVLFTDYTPEYVIRHIKEPIL